MYFFMHVADFMESGENGDCLFTSSFHFKGFFCVWVCLCNLLCEGRPNATLMITVYRRGSPILRPVMVSYLFSFPFTPAGEWKSIKLSSDWWDGFWMIWGNFSETWVRLSHRVKMEVFEIWTLVSSSHRALIWMNLSAFPTFIGFLGGSMGKEATDNTRDLSLIPGLGRSPGEGNGNPLQYSCLGESMNREAWQAAVHGVSRDGHNWAVEILALVSSLH